MPGLLESLAIGLRIFGSEPTNTESVALQALAFCEDGNSLYRDLEAGVGKRMTKVQVNTARRIIEKYKIGLAKQDGSSQTET